MPLMEVGRLKAIQDPQGKSRGRLVIVAIHLPTEHSPRRKAGFCHDERSVAKATNNLIFIGLS